MASAIATELCTVAARFERGECTAENVRYAIRLMRLGSVQLEKHLKTIRKLRPRKKRERLPQAVFDMLYESASGGPYEEWTA